MTDTPKILWPALRQYRHNNDNSPDLSNPEGGFVTGFDYAETCDVARGLQKRIEALEQNQRAEDCVWQQVEDESGFLFWESPCPAGIRTWGKVDDYCRGCGGKVVKQEGERG